jgi:mannose-6-phosphate isomerase-like protein (cupin superfamily)
MTSAPVLPFIVRADVDRFETPAVFLNGRFDVKVSGKDTGGALCVIDTIRRRPGGPPVHYHHAQDEWFYVLDGDFKFRVGDELFVLGPGDSTFGPRGLPHGFRNLTPTGRLMIAFQPALTMETFFALAGVDPLSERFAALSREHGMEIVAHPLEA